MNSLNSPFEMTVARSDAIASLPAAELLSRLAARFGSNFASPNIIRRHEDDSAFREEGIPCHPNRRGWGIND